MSNPPNASGTPSAEAMALTHHRNACASRGGRYACNCGAKKDAARIDSALAHARAEERERCEGIAELARGFLRDIDKDFDRGRQFACSLIIDNIRSLPDTTRADDAQEQA